LNPLEQNRADVLAVATPTVRATTQGADASRLHVNFHFVQSRAAHLGGEGMSSADRVPHPVDAATGLAQTFWFQQAIEIGLGEIF
jgi:hypothetical protein